MMRVRDARGNVRLLGWSTEMPARETADRRRAWVEYAQYRNVGAAGRFVWTPRLLIGFLGATLVLAAVGFSTGVTMGLLFLVMGAAGYFVVTYAAPYADEMGRRRSSQEVQRCLGFCPLCDYDLRGLGAEGDGCVVCPECGGAWRAGEVPEFV